MTDWVIAADDRTGALEVSGMCGGGVVTTRLEGRAGGATVVVDLGSRHLPAADAAARSAAMERHSAARAGHKVDSLLRGNWAEELLARDRRTVVVPAFPAMGRTCAGGVVRAGGVPVDQLDDTRRGARTSRPAERLGADEVRPDTLAAWLAGEGRRAVCDAATDDDLAAIAAILDDHPDVLVAGTAGTLAAAAHGHPVQAPLPLPAPALVISGSLHPTALRQLAAVAEVGDLTTLSAQIPVAPTLTDSDAVVAALAAKAHQRLDGMRTLVIIGGDTAAAVLGPGDVTVDGTVGPGMPWCRRVLDRDLQLVTKAGAFGDATTIIRLFSR